MRKTLAAALAAVALTGSVAVVAGPASAGSRWGAPAVVSDTPSQRFVHNPNDVDFLAGVAWK